MHPALEGISEHMQILGLGILSQAQKNVFFWHYVNMYDTTLFGALQTAHAAPLDHLIIGRDNWVSLRERGLGFDKP